VIFLTAFFLVLYAGGVALLWRATWRAHRLVQEPPPEWPDAADTTDWPTLDVVIPVKDEEGNIGPCVRSILSQDYPRFRVIVVNDRSTDRTAEIVAEIQEQHPELRRIDVTELPSGLYGKPHALVCASREFSSELIAFIDSDLQLAPHCLRTLVNRHRIERLDWLAVMGTPELTLFWERLLIPLLGAMAYAWYDPRKIQDPNQPEAIGSGFMIVRREAYEAVGGHGSVVRAYDEDSAIMRIAKRTGQRIAYVLAPELYTLRLYGSLRKTIHGITRTYIGGIKTIPRFLITIGGLNFVSLAPVGLLIALGALHTAGIPILWEPVWWTLASLHLAAATLLACLVYSAAGGSRVFALLHPLGAAMLIGICAHAARRLHQGRPIEWRGTSY